jgi:myosin heavy subunit
LDVDRLTKRQELESTFHVFYYLWEGASDELQKHLHFNAIDRPFFNPLKDQEDRNAAQVGWSHLLGALDKLKLNENQIQGIVNVLGAIFHLLHR